MSDPVADMGRVAVRRVLDRHEPEVDAQRTGLGPPQAEQRMALGRHAGQPVDAAASQQVDEHGLGLVVGGVAGEHAVPAAPRRGRRAPGPRGWARDRRRPVRPRNAAPKRRAAAAHDLGLGCRAGPQPVVDVHGGHRQPAAVASTRSANESAPPETAHVTARPAGGNRHRPGARRPAGRRPPRRRPPCRNGSAARSWRRERQAT